MTVRNAAILVAIGGLSGSGKSTLALTLAAERGAVCYRSDIERKRLFGVSTLERLGPEGYAPHVTADVYRRLSEAATAALDNGQNVIVDAVFQRRHERNAITAVAQTADADFVGLWLEAPVGLRLQRVAARTGDASDATPDVVEAQALRDCGDISWHRLDSSIGPAHVLAAAREILARAKS